MSGERPSGDVGYRDEASLQASLARVEGVDLTQPISSYIPAESIYAERLHEQGKQVDTIYGIPKEMFENGELSLDEQSLI